MEYAAIRHFADKRYCYALEKGHFLIRLELKKDDAAKVILHTQDKYLPVQFTDTRQQYEMEIAASDNYLDYYEMEVHMDVVCLRYFFEIEDRQGNRAYYGNHGFYDSPVTDIGRMFDCPQTLREEERFQLPLWAENKVIYQIFPSRFATDKEVPREDWYQAPIDSKTDLKGSLRGILNHFDHIRDLGVDILYLTPIFQSGSTHKYNTEDYYRIDPSFGTKEDLKELVSLAHQSGMYVILDGVFNHTGTDFFAFRDIMEKKDQSSYLDWYYIQGFPLVPEQDKRPNYKTFSYAAYMPKLNLCNPAAADYMIQVAAYWIRECDIDGWRLDVADEIGHSFWKRFRREMKAVKKDVLLVGEVWHYAGDFLEGDEWDSVMNYPFHDSLQDLIIREESGPSAFWGNLSFVNANLHTKLEGYLWNFIDSHDTPRLLHSVGGHKGKQRLAAAMELLLPGMPMIYYGDEVGLDGGPGSDCRRGMLWEEERQDRECLAYYRRLIRIRHGYPALTRGKLIKQYADDQAGILYLERTLEQSHAILIFHTKKGSVFLAELSHGWRNLIDDRDFDGTLDEYETAVLVRTVADRRADMEQAVTADMSQTMTVNGKEYQVKKLLGKGKGGYSYLVGDGQREYVLKQIHHEPCDYYQFGNKMEAETGAYGWLKKIGIRMPQLIEVDEEKERILKEYIEGDTIYELILHDKMQPDYIEQLRRMCGLLYAANTNIDYFPTNFVVRGGELYYIDFECNTYMEEWNFENWGIKYWSKTPEFLKIKI